MVAQTEGLEGETDRDAPGLSRHLGGRVAGHGSDGEARSDGSGGLGCCNSLWKQTARKRTCLQRRTVTSRQPT